MFQFITKLIGFRLYFLHAKLIHFDDPDSKNNDFEDSIMKMLEVLVDYIFLAFFCDKGPTESWYFNGNQMWPSSSRHISLLIWSRIYTVFALNQKETAGITVQFHIQVHR